MKKFNVSLIIIFSLIIMLILLVSPVAQAQYWAALPPYNTLWPLWSPALSPVNPTTGLPTPIVNQLSRFTTLPVQPALTWDPTWNYPWLLYNTGFGMGYYDQIYGFNMWPPAQATFPVNLPLGFESLPPTPITWGQQYLPTANLTYAYLFGLDPALFTGLLTPAALWGL